MWIIRISLDLYGEKFSPTQFIKDISDTIQIFSFNEPDDLKGKDLNEIYGFGSLSILAPQIYGLQYEMAGYENWYLDFIDKNKNLFDNSGITQINLFIDVFDDGGQLNFEIFSRELLKKVGLYDIAIPISYHRVTTQQIIDMLTDAGVTQDKLQQYVDIG